MVKVAIVTGANKGIGYQIARQLLLKDWAVVMACRSRDRAATAADKLLGDAEVSERVKATKGLGVHPVAFDLEAPDTFEKSVSEIKHLYPDGVDSIVHNAGFAFTSDATEPFSEQAEKTLKINFFNTIKASEAFLPLVRDGGRIVFMASRAGYLSVIPDEKIRHEFVKDDVTVDSLRELARTFVSLAKDDKHKDKGWPTTAYGTSKAFLAAYARLLSREKRIKEDRRIAVNWCCPGWCKTDMAGDEAPRTPEEGADTPVWLASDESATESGFFWGERKKLDWENGKWD